MRVSTQAFHAPKKGNSEAEYEDAFFPDGCEREAAEFRCAIADGASESAFAQVWAALLVRGFAERQMHLEQLRQKWLASINGQSLPWFLERKVKAGAYAAFVGLSIRENARHNSNGKAAKDEPQETWLDQHGVAAPVKVAGTWRAVAIGDSCLFQVRGDELVTVGPIGKSNEFDNSPYLLGSKGKDLLRRSAENVTVLIGVKPITALITKNGNIGTRRKVNR